MTASSTTCRFTFVVDGLAQTALASLGQSKRYHLEDNTLMEGANVRLSGRQLAIMRVLWDHGEATVAQVQEALDLERPLAYSTVATVISRMEQKGLVTHRAEGRVHYYQPTISEDSAGESMVGELVTKIFGGSPAELVSHLLQSDQVDAEELERIKQLVRRHQRQSKRKREEE